MVANIEHFAVCQALPVLDLDPFSIGVGVFLGSGQLANMSMNKKRNNIPGVTGLAYPFTFRKGVTEQVPFVGNHKKKKEKQNITNSSGGKPSSIAWNEGNSESEFCCMRNFGA